MTSTVIDIILALIMDFPTPLTLLDYFLAELEWRFNRLHEGIWELINDCEDLKEEWGYYPSPRPPHKFDPLQTLY
jgi:hypothetical protein